MRAWVRVLAFAAMGLGSWGSLAAQEGDATKNAKALFFDRKYEAARTAWSGIARTNGSEGITALYWIAQCSEKLGQDERALEEYAAYLAKRPAGQLAEDARTSRVRIATRLARNGNDRHLGLVTQSLSDSNRTVRYYSALQMCSLGAPRGNPAVSVLQAMVREESDPDLLERAKLCLVKLGAARTAQAAGGGTGRWFRVEITKRGEANVSIRMPLSFADLVLKSLPDDARAELRQKGVDADNVLSNLKGLPGSELVNIVGDDGERIRIWIE